MHNQVELLGYYGGDETHALSAWTSTQRELTKAKRNRIDKLIKYLAENGHHTPFEKSYLHFLVTCDTASHIHLIKHRIGVSINAESARYKELTDKWHIPNDWSAEEQHVFNSYCETAYGEYHRALKRIEATHGRKRAKESARYYLPYAAQVTMDIGFNFRSFIHFQHLRNKDDAQYEIREIAKKMLTLVRETGKFNFSLEGFGYEADIPLR
ncbi:MAG: FAD-dependent thymidylate synthase [Nitrososphaera sp.]|nr:FAD-dependent thymidylate synthase [Nitrososphaera sp.]